MKEKERESLTSLIALLMGIVCFLLGSVLLLSSLFGNRCGDSVVSGGILIGLGLWIVKVEDTR